MTFPVLLDPTTVQFHASLTISGGLITDQPLSVSNAQRRIRHLPKANRLPAVLSLAPRMTAGDWAELLGSVWFECSDHSVHTNAIRELIALPCTLKRMMTDRELRYVPPVPVKLAIYRVASDREDVEQGANHLVWFADAATAVRQAQEAPGRTIVRATVWSNEILAYKQAHADSHPIIITVYAKSASVTSVFTLSRSARSGSKGLL